MILYSCIALFGFQLLIAILLQLAAQKGKAKNIEESCAGLSVIVPFHNEALRIQPLIDSLNALEDIEHVEFIFVNDNSTDTTEQILEMHLNISFECIRNLDDKGKKQAIRSGVRRAKYDYIITWDADVSIPRDYFKRISKINKVDLNVFPVQMEAEGLIGKLAIIEFTFLETLGFGMAGVGQYSIAYGANLGFRKSAFWEVDEVRKDYTISSGDDLFVLAGMQEVGKVIAVNYDKNLAVKTDAPNGFVDLIQQRRRWFGKMNLLFDQSTILPLILLICVQFAGVITLVFSFTNVCFLIPLGVKFLAEGVASWRFVQRNPLNGLVLLIHQIWYPLYLLSLGIPFPQENRWRS